MSQQPGPIGDSGVYLGDGHFLLNARCERCELIYTTTMRVGYRYRPLCPPCAEATGETVEVGLVPESEVTP